MISNLKKISRLSLRSLFVGVLAILLATFSFSPLIFNTEKVEAAWYNSDWDYRRTITIDNGQVSGSSNHTNFPMLFSGTYSYLADTSNGGKVEQSDGGDIVFTNSAGTKLDHELVTYDNTTGAVQIWIEIPTLDYNDNTIVYMYYGNNTGVADQENVSGTWSAYQGVWHLDDAPSDGGTTDDATGNQDGTWNGTGSTSATGQIGSAFTFDGDEDHINATDIEMDTWTDITISGWFKSSNDTTTMRLISKDYVGTPGTWIIEHTDSTDNFRFLVRNDTDNAWDTATFSTASTHLDDNWFYVVGVVDNTTDEVRLYIDGTEGTSVAWGSNSTLEDDDNDFVAIGADSASGAKQREWDGEIDEIHIYNGVRSEDWIDTEYANQNSPSTFYYIGSEITSSAEGSWYDSGWDYRKTITIDESKIGGSADLTNFPVLYSVTDTDLRDTANGGNVQQSDGGDILFTSSDEASKLDHEIEKYDNTTGELVAWVELPTLDYNDDTVIYMYYGNDGGVADQENQNGTWNANYKAVWHMAEDPAVAIEDSTSGGHDSTADPGVPPSISGVIGDAVDFNGNDAVNFPNVDTISTSTTGTISAWITIDDIDGGNGGIVGALGNSQTFMRYYDGNSGQAYSGHFNILSNGTGTAILYANDVTISNGTNYHVKIQQTGSGFKMYINGAEQTLTAFSGSVSNTGWIDDQSSSSPVYVGRQGTSSNPMRGLVDEVRISDVVESADWILAEYNNQNSPGTFYSTGSEQANNSAPNTPTNSSPSNTATNQSLNPTLTSSAFSDPDGGDTHADTTWQVDDDSDFATPVWTRTAGSGETTTSITSANGTFANELSGQTDLDVNTTYYWQVRYQDNNAEWSSYSSSTSFTTSQTPSTPSNSSPSNGALNLDKIPTLTSSSFSDNDTTSTHGASQWLIRTLSDTSYSSPAYDSGTDTTNKTAITVPTGNLAENTTYYWKVRHQDEHSLWSSYSSETAFSTGVIPVSVIAVGATEYTSDETAVLTVQVKDADGDPVNTATTTVDIYSPSASLLVDDGSMSYISGSNGLYRYTYDIPETNGVYIYETTATYSGETGYAAHTFHVSDALELISTINTTLNGVSTTISGIETKIDTLISEIGTGQISAILTDTAAISWADVTAILTDTATISWSDVTAILADTSNIDTNVTTLVSEIGSGNISAIKTKTDTIDWTDVDAILTDTTAINWSDITSIEAKIDTIDGIVDTINTNTTTLLGGLIVTTSSVNDASASTTSFVSSLTNTVDDYYNNSVIVFTSGVLSGQTRRISDYDGSSKTITVSPALTSAPANSVTFTITSQNVYVQSQAANIESTLSSITSTLSTISSNISTLLTNLATVDTNLDSVQTTVNSIRTSQQKAFRADISNVSAVQNGGTYRTTVSVYDFESNQTDADSQPSITIYDPTGSAQVSAANMSTTSSTGIYQYSYTLATSSTTGLWETHVDVTEAGNTITLVDHFRIGGAPAEVVVNSVSTETPTITANVTISNEGTGDQEYQYTWCVVDSIAGQCTDGSGVVYTASAAKLIAQGDTFTTNLNSTVSDDGTYWFKIVVYYGTESSGASQQFTAAAASDPGGGGGGGISGGTGLTSTGQVVTLDTIYSELVALRGQVDSDSQVLGQTLQLLGDTVDPESPGFKPLLEVNQENTQDLKDLQNKIIELRAVSNTTKSIVENQSAQPIVETFFTFGSIEINFLITNPISETQTLTFRSFLPEEARPEHVLDSDGLAVEFDANANTYYVTGEITLGPNASVVKTVRMEDIWRFEDEDLNLKLTQAQDLADLLKKTQYETSATLLLNDIKTTINIVKTRQRDSESAPEIQILAYRENKARMDNVDANLDRLQDLAVQSGVTGGFFGRLAGVQTASTWGIILAIVFGFGIAGAAIFGMWRHQMRLAAAIAGDHRFKDQNLMTRLSEQTLKGGSGSRRKKKKPLTKTMKEKLKKTITFGSIAGIVFTGILVAIVVAVTGDKKDKEQTVVEEVDTTPIIQEPVVVPTVEVPEPVIVAKVRILSTPTGWLRVRALPTTNSSEISRVNPGDTFEFISERDGWFSILLSDGLVGWVSGDFVERFDEEA